VTDKERPKWLRAWAAAVLVGLVTVGFFIVFIASAAVSNAVPVLVGGLILLLVIAGWAWWAWRRGKRELAIGVAAGYGVLSLVSGGQCTLFVSGEFDAGLNAGTGFFAYLLLLIAALIIGGVASMLSRHRDRKGGEA
jgi:hypothetical protein